MNSLRRRMTWLLVAATAAVAVGSGSWLYVYVRNKLLEEFDDGLTAKARAIGSLVHVEEGRGFELEFADRTLPEYARKRNPEYFQIYLPGGKVLARSPSLGERDLMPPEKARPHSNAFDFTLPDGASGRGRSIRVAPQVDDGRTDALGVRRPHPTEEAGDVLVIVARSRQEVDWVLRSLLSGISLGGLLLVAGSTLAVRLIVAHGLRPVLRLSDEAAAIGPETLGTRFDAERFPEELQPICLRLNDLLERLDTAFRRERRLNADIAHELRTPIAELRSLAEVASRWPGDAEAAAAYFRDVHEIAMRMGSLVETILALGRAQAVVPGAMSRGPVVLEPVVVDAVERSRPAAEARSLTLSVRIPADLAVAGDELLLSQICENLSSNAVQYAPPGGTVDWAAERAGDRVTLSVSNAAESLTEADLAHLFEPFWRKDPARAGDGHAGLGLSLVTEYARQMGGTIDATLQDGGKLTIRLSFAAADAVPVTETPVVVEGLSY